MHLKRKNVSSVAGIVRNVVENTVTFHGHVKLKLMTTAATLNQIDIYNFVYISTAFVLYNHDCYNIEILTKLLTFFYSTFTNVLFVSRF